DMVEFTFPLTAEAQRFFELLFFLGAAHFAQALSHIEICLRMAILAAFPDPGAKLCCIADTLAAVDQRGWRAVFKFEIASVAALPHARFVPNARHSPHAAHQAAADQTHDIERMRAPGQPHTAACTQLV